MSVQNVPPPMRVNAPPPLQIPGGLGPGPLAPLPPRRNSLLSLQTTLGRFKLLAALIIVLAVVALAVSYLILSTTATNFEQVVTRITPSIDAAERLGEAIEEMDARAAEYQLTSRIDVTSPDFRPEIYGDKGVRNATWEELLKRRVEVDNALTLARSKASAAQPRNPDEQERVRKEKEALNRISNRFYDYYARINLMRYELDLGRKEAALANYKAAQDILVGNLGQAEQDEQARSKEKVLKDSNWQATKYTCKVSCPNGTQDRAVDLNFDKNQPYNGIAANVHLLSVLNTDELDTIPPPSDLNSLLVLVTAGLLLASTLIIAVYYAMTTHRIINIGFGLALVLGLAVAWLLVANLYSATQVYRQFTNEYTKLIVTTSSIRQLSADASADISRLLLSPASPGLDSTNPALTSDVKKAFASETLLAAYDSKSKQVDQKLQELARLSRTSNSDRAQSEWLNFTGKVGTLTKADSVLGKFNRRLLADAIYTYIDPSTQPNSASARQPYNNFVVGVKAVSDLSKSNFDKRACESIGQSEFNNSCNQNGYLNDMQVLIWIAFPLLSLLVAGGVWFASRLF